MTGFVAQSFKKNQESLYYLKLSDFIFLVVIIIFNNNKKYFDHIEGLFYSLKVLTCLLHYSFE